MSRQGVIQISGRPVNEKELIVSFKLLPGSNPVERGYFVAIWEGDHILSAAEALKTIKITTRQQSGEVVFDGLFIGKKNYTVGLGLSREGNEQRIFAVLSVPLHPKSKLPVILSNVIVAADHIGTNFLAAQFVTPVNHQSKTNDNWIALFHGQFNEEMYKGTQVIAVTKADTNQHSGLIIMKNIPSGLSRFGTYTLVFGTGLDQSGKPDFKMLISSHTFIVWKSSIYLGVAATAQGAVQHTISSYQTGRFNPSFV